MLIEKQRMTASHDDDIAVFIIGMRVNKWLAFRKWWPVFTAMQTMLKELIADKDSGFLGAETMFRSPRMPVLIQYWRSFDDLHSYAHDQDRAHRPAWAAFNRAMVDNGDVGIFHETYLVAPGQHENVYANMPLFGLAKATGWQPATGQRKDAKARLERGIAE